MPTNQQQSQNNGSILQQILQAISQVAAPIGQATGQAAVSGMNALGSLTGIPTQGNQAQSQGAEQAGQQAGQQLAPPQNNAYQKGVEKALKEGGYAHTQEALAAGIPADHIVQRAGLNQGSMGQSQQGQQTGGQPQQPQSQNMGMQLLKGFLAGPLIANQKTQQAGLETQSMQQKVSGQEPIQPQQKAEMGARMFGAQREALQAEVGGYNDQLKTLMDQFTQIRKSPMAVASGMDKTILKNIDTINNKLSKSIKNLKSLTFGKQKENSVPAGATHYSPSQNKYYDAQGKEVK